MSKVVIFRNGDAEYAIPLQNVVSIEKIEAMTPIPQMSDYVKGMIEIRGQIIPIIDLEYIFYKRYLKTDESARLVVTQLGEYSLGILVKEAKEIIEIPPEKIKQVGLISNSKTAYIIGITSLEGRLVTIIDPVVLFESLDGIEELQEYLKSQAV